jgi:hypothetical protein
LKRAALNRRNKRVNFTASSQHDHTSLGCTLARLCWNYTVIAMVCAPRPQHDIPFGISRKKIPQVFTVPVPKFLTRKTSPNSTAKNTTDDLTSW